MVCCNGTGTDYMINKVCLQKKMEISRWEFNGPVGLRPADLEQLLYIKVTKI